MLKLPYHIKGLQLTLWCFFQLSFTQPVFAKQMHHSAIDNDVTIVLSTEQQNAMGMQTAIAQTIDMIPSAIYPAQAMISLHTIRSLSSPLAGKISLLNFVHGPITKGQVIVAIESPELLTIQEEYLSTLSDLSISQSNLSRAKKLNKSGVSSTKKLQQEQSTLNKLSLKKIQLEKKLFLLGVPNSAISKLKKSRHIQPPILEVKSPINGQLFNLEIKLGERIKKNKTIISLGETNPIILTVRVPVSMLTGIQKNQQVKILSIHNIGIVKFIDSIVDPMTQSVDIHIQVKNDQGQLRVGQLFNIRFLTPAKKTTYKISQNAISHFEGNTVVFVKNNNNNNNNIEALLIDVINITEQTMFFTLKTPHTSPLQLYIKGSSAIKLAMEGENEPDNE